MDKSELLPLNSNGLEMFFGDPVLFLGFASFLLLLISTPIAFWSLGGGSSSRIVRLLVALANLSLASLLVLRWWDSGHFPVSNLYEF